MFYSGSYDDLKTTSSSSTGPSFDLATEQELSIEGDDGASTTLSSTSTESSRELQPSSKYHVAFILFFISSIFVFH